MRRHGWIRLLLPAVVAGCTDDLTGGDRFPRLEGSYLAVAAVRPDGGDAARQGSVVGVRFVQGTNPVFRLVEMPPPVQFRRAALVEGYFQTNERQEVLFFSTQNVELDVATFTRSGERVLLELRGTLGFRRLELDPVAGLEPGQLAGRYTAASFTLRDSTSSFDIVGAGGRATLELGPGVTYRFEMDTHGAALGGVPSTLTYQGAYDTAGPLLLLGGAFGCDVFVAQVSLGTNLGIQGVGCSVGGRVGVVEGVFRRN